jgi:4-azaleucine resistance transporter AzlC
MVRIHSDDHERPQVCLTAHGTWRGFLGLLPVASFSIPFGMGFGAAATESGLSVIESVVMSMFVFSGAAQFSMLPFLSAPAAYLSVALVVLAVSARHVVMSAALGPWLNQLPLGRRFIVMAWLSDPNFATAQPALRNGHRDMGILLGGGLALWLCWICGTLVGAVSGHALVDVRVFGIDALMLCFFAAVLAGYLGNWKTWSPIALSALSAIVLAHILPQGWNIIVAALAGAMISLAQHGE